VSVDNIRNDRPCVVGVDGWRRRHDEGCDPGGDRGDASGVATGRDVLVSTA
jgi:hypothetical protein